MKWFRRKKAIENHERLKEYHFECRHCGNKWSHKSIHPPTGVEICNQCSSMRCGKDIRHEIKMLMDSNNGTSFACSECYVEYFKPKEDKEMKFCDKCMKDFHVGAHVEVDDRFIDICFDCYSKYIVLDGQGGCKWKNKHKCKCCSVKIDIKLDYCASCVKDKEEPKMKEFDLRPFEVKKPIDNVTVTTYHSVKGPVFSEDDAVNIIGYISQQLKLSGPNGLRIFPFNHKEWQWEDIQVGWFFKTYNTHNKAKSICIKVSETDFTWLYDFARDDKKCSRDTWLNNHHRSIWNEDGCSKENITNVYDCPELAKVLMIERIVT